LQREEKKKKKKARRQKIRMEALQTLFSFICHRGKRKGEIRKETRHFVPSPIGTNYMMIDSEKREKSWPGREGYDECAPHSIFSSRC